MIELLLATASPGVVNNGDFAFAGEVSLDSYASVFSALGLSGGTVFTGTAYLSYGYMGKRCYVPKKPIASNLPYNTLLTAGLADGATIPFAGGTYLVRFIRGMADAVDKNTLPTFTDGGSYPNNATFANAEWARLIAPIVNRSGASPEGIPYGTAARYSVADLGFGNAVQGNATMCAEHDSSNFLIRGSNDENYIYRRSRTTASAYWALRPLLIQQA